MKKLILIIAICLLSIIVLGDTKPQNIKTNIKELSATVEDTNVEKIPLKKYSFNYNGIKEYCLVKESTSNNYAVIFHGHGAHADQLFKPIDDWYLELEKRDFGLICMDLQGNSWMNTDNATIMHQMLTYFKKEFKINKLIFAGGSMGGTSAIIYPLYYPKDMDGIIADCPCANMTDYYHSLLNKERKILVEIRETIKNRYKGTPETSSMYKKSNANEHPEIYTMPLVIYHGDADEYIPFEFTKVLMDELKDKPNFKYKIIIGGNHASATDNNFKEQLDFICDKLNIK